MGIGSDIMSTHLQRITTHSSLCRRLLQPRFPPYSRTNSYHTNTYSVLILHAPVYLRSQHIYSTSEASSNMAIPATLTGSFTLFPLLPTELRLEIYTQMLNLTSNPAPKHTSAPRILKINYSPPLDRYISNAPAPPTLCLCSESREHTMHKHGYKHLLLGPPFFCMRSTSIPIHFPSTTLYISSLHPLMSTFAQSFVYHLSTSSSRHSIGSLAIDLRVWNELCENGFLGVLAGMKGLRELMMVVEFGRKFEGELGFLEIPEWRSDLRWVARRARDGLMEEGRKGRKGRNLLGDRGEGNTGSEERGEVDVRCVFLTRGGEQA
ncbi:hypothetical protein BJ875DRAFT_469558 [Amylocarpus encephaloides]|uniref:2EXR domain-containing protein n=1 Tax=Amylocarpus encephaloides TaxID=45428 RepID=A0A9P7YD27_9HELO|nr:hypothetical protein BJ875DRAFT_469558 [Amylocarpus encephaloides]